ncbi:hypothetical protein EVAR_61688_1 [Eumeta japonica]|uniref:Uncharacterized protein n=1 Tax=Eumeta variegata TaxID=151549 RepID=A0A4C1ZZ01_EUMVA|nr:hypothetical protein EVAR_61688_1 [Eumeta japonica]
MFSPDRATHGAGAAQAARRALLFIADIRYRRMRVPVAHSSLRYPTTIHHPTPLSPPHSPFMTLLLFLQPIPLHLIFYSYLREQQHNDNSFGRSFGWYRPLLSNGSHVHLFL